VPNTTVPNTTVPNTTDMIDLHTHVLPGIDDGARTFEEALEMCRQAAGDGCSGLVATPHLRHSRWWNGDRERLEELRAELVRRLDEPFEIFLGGEIAVHSDSVEEIYDLPGGELPTLAGSRYVLLELDWHGLGPNVLDVVHELVVKGLFPVIAHPERYRWLAADPALIETLVERGAYLQLTAMSVTGDLGSGIRRLCENLVAAEIVHFVASDAHDARLRPPGLGRAFRQIEDAYGDEAAQRIFVTHPRAVVEDRRLDQP
jgi:protein-tyrosine phosphatase